MRIASFRATFVACALFAPVVATQAASMDTPKRKPGLWQQTVTTTGLAVPPQSMSMCTDEKTDDLIASRAGQAQECQQQSIRREGGAFVVDAVCRSGGTTIRTHGRFSGDFAIRYSGELRSTFEPPMQGMKETRRKSMRAGSAPASPGRSRATLPWTAWAA